MLSHGCPSYAFASSLESLERIHEYQTKRAVDRSAIVQSHCSLIMLPSSYISLVEDDCFSRIALTDWSDSSKGDQTLHP